MSGMFLPFIGRNSSFFFGIHVGRFLNSGTYLINVNMNGKVLTEKLIIAK